LLSFASKVRGKALVLSYYRTGSTSQKNQQYELYFDISPFSLLSGQMLGLQITKLAQVTGWWGKNKKNI
jgi:hypothetical protein